MTSTVKLTRWYTEHRTAERNIVFADQILIKLYRQITGILKQLICCKWFGGKKEIIYLVFWRKKNFPRYYCPLF